MSISFSKLVLRVAGQIVLVQTNVWLATRIVQMLEKQTQNVTKAGYMRTFSAESVDLSHLGPERVSYPPKNIHTEAIHVTIENIGKLSLEFEEELFFDSQGRPFFAMTAERFTPVEGDKCVPQELYVRLTDWIVPLRGELHVFRDNIFTNTFTFDVPRHRPDDRPYDARSGLLVLDERTDIDRPGPPPVD